MDSDGTEGKSEKVADFTGEGTVALRTGSRRLDLSTLSFDWKAVSETSRQ